MQRRLFIGLALALPGLARAHHGWSSFDTSRPLWLAGRVVRSRWRNPHAELDLQPDAGLKLPPDLASRSLPAQSASVEGPALLARAQLPRRPDRRWVVELAPLTRLEAWRLPQVQPGTQVEVLGYAFQDEQGAPLLRAEYLFVDGKAYGLRSSPA